jgi:hypothetical protein
MSPLSYGLQEIYDPVYMCVWGGKVVGFVSASQWEKEREKKEREREGEEEGEGCVNVL